MPTTFRSDFTTRLFAKLAKTQEGKNLFLSPFSIQVALAMCAVGARGETRKALTDLIGAPESVEEQNLQYAEWIKPINGEGERLFQLVTANALWGQDGFHFKPDFQETIADFYDGAFHVVNFLTLPDEAVITINRWIEGKTGGKIKDLIQRRFIGQDTRLILTNAIYFKGKWEAEFSKFSTRNEDWYGYGGTKKVPMMNQKGDYLYYRDDDFQALDIPYRGEQLSMLVVLPRKNDGLNALEDQWIAKEIYQHVTKGLEWYGMFNIFLPRFKMETEFLLQSVLCELGAELAFGGDADFSGISQEGLMISEVIHKAFVEVNEEGTEAAGATGISMTTGSKPIHPRVFKADHPFLFFIRDSNTNAVLFCGRVLDPE